MDLFVLISVQLLLLLGGARGLCSAGGAGLGSLGSILGLGLGLEASLRLGLLVGRGGGTEFGPGSETLGLVGLWSSVSSSVRQFVVLSNDLHLSSLSYDLEAIIVGESIIVLIIVTLKVIIQHLCSLLFGFLDGRSGTGSARRTLIFTVTGDTGVHGALLFELLVPERLAGSRSSSSRGGRLVADSSHHLFPNGIGLVVSDFVVTLSGLFALLELVLGRGVDVVHVIEILKVLVDGLVHVVGVIRDNALEHGLLHKVIGSKVARGHHVCVQKVRADTDALELLHDREHSWEGLSSGLRNHRVLVRTFFLTVIVSGLTLGRDRARVLVAISVTTEGEGLDVLALSLVDRVGVGERRVEDSVGETLTREGERADLGTGVDDGLVIERRRAEEGQFATEPVAEDHLGGSVNVRLTARKETTRLEAELLEKVIGVLPAVDAVRVLQVLGLDGAHEIRDVERGVLDVLNAHDSLEHGGRLVVTRVIDDTGTVDEEDALEERDVLPHLGLTRNGRDLADLLLLERVDDATLSDVGVADETDTDLALVAVQTGKLAQQLDEGSLSKRVVETGVEGQRGVLTREKLNPSGSHPRGNQVTLVEDDDELLVFPLLLEMVLDVLGSSADGVTGVEHLDQHV
mmetsp:Transcript_54403/g.90418  ORF Transcript_54403/g.90418 Transcript_54403/m.90418 type:complete len:630 (-) Transcript_54403:747-2636(-)